mmetsp:Transcript_12494/g.35787  ORF Transcript_12494/g.35787 Transcript_12494/m.35787 type:complete len:238 (-) Transcript_12494:474-1187(-)
MLPTCFLRQVYHRPPVPAYRLPCRRLPIMDIAGKRHVDGSLAWRHELAQRRAGVVDGELRGDDCQDLVCRHWVTLSQELVGQLEIDVGVGGHMAQPKLAQQLQEPARLCVARTRVALPMRRKQQTRLHARHRARVFQSCRWCRSSTTVDFIDNDEQRLVLAAAGLVEEPGRAAVHTEDDVGRPRVIHQRELHTSAVTQKALHQHHVREIEVMQLVRVTPFVPAILEARQRARPRRQR